MRLKRWKFTIQSIHMQDKKINILFIISSLEFGGAQRQVIDLVNRMSEDHFNIHLLTFERQLAQLDRLDKIKVVFHSFPRQHKFDLSPTREIAKIIRNKKIDIIHCTNQISLLFGFFGKLRSRKRIKLVFAIHTTVARDLKHEVLDWFLFAPLMIFCQFIITVCHNQRFLWSKKYPLLREKFITIYNGIDMDSNKITLTEKDRDRIKKTLGFRDREFIIAILAEFRPEKGHEYVFYAVKKLLGSGYDIKLLLIGDGERKEYLQSLSHRLSIYDNIIWLGFQKDPGQYLSISDVVIFAALESFSIAMLEAFSLGIPVVAADAGGTPEMLQDGENGFLFKLKDIDSMVKKITLLITDIDLRNKLAGNSRDSVINRFSIEKMVDKTETLLIKLTSI